VAKLSISRAWDETREVLGRDGRLLSTVAVALLALPSTVQNLMTPETKPGELPPVGPWLVVLLITVLIGIVGQLAIARLALGSQTSVGEAISHGAKRLLPYFLAMLLWVGPIAIFLLFAAQQMRPPTPSAGMAVLFLVMLVLLIFLAVRLIIAVAVASAEPLGPLGILQRSWQLTSGSWWRLFGFLALFIVAVLCVMIAVGAIIGILAGIALGPAEPMSVAALVIALVTQLAIAAVTVVFLVMLTRIYLQLAARNVSVPETAV
jgi:hypothetical protein